MPPKADKWGKGHKADFLEKVRQCKINVNVDDPKYIEQIREKYWPDRKPATFRNNWKATVAELWIGQSINSRNGESFYNIDVFTLHHLVTYNFVSAEAASREETNIEEDDIEGTNNITEEAEDLTEEEEEDKMPPKKNMKKTPTNKKATPSASQSPVRDAIDDLIGGLEGVTVENKRYSFMVLDPYKVHPYVKSEVMLFLERFSPILFRKT